MKPARLHHRLLLLTCVAACVVGCEERVVSSSTNDGYFGMRMIPTQVQAPPPPPEQPWTFPNPLKWIGDGFAGIAGLFPGGGSKSMQIDSQGQTIQVPAGYTGQTNFTAADGRSYYLHFQNGTLVGVAPQTPAAAPAAPAQPAPAPGP